MSVKNLSDRTYTILAVTGDFTLPVVGVILYIVSRFIDIPRISLILASFLAIIFIIGLILLFSSTGIVNKHSGRDGEIIITMSPEGKKTFSLELETDPNELEGMDVISFKVVSDTKPDIAE